MKNRQLLISLLLGMPIAIIILAGYYIHPRNIDLFNILDSIVAFIAYTILFSYTFYGTIEISDAIINHIAKKDER